VKYTDVSEVLTATVIKQVEDGGSALQKRLSTSTRLHGVIFKKALIFKLAAMRT
jgi:hypothetical protein